MIWDRAGGGEGLKQPACGEREGVSHGGIGVIRWWGRCGGSSSQPAVSERGCPTVELG